MQTIATASAGSLCVAGVGLFIAFFSFYLFSKRPDMPWNAWGALGSLAVSLYAVAVFFQYNTPEGQGNRLAELVQYTSFVLIIHFLYGYTSRFLGLPFGPYNRVFIPVHGLLLLVLWGTPLVVSHEFVHRSFYWLARPYVEPAPTPLGVVYLLYIALAGARCWWLWIKNRGSGPTHGELFIMGGLFWLFFGVHDVLATMGMETYMFAMEYGALGVSVSILMVTVKSYLELFVAVEESDKRYKNILESIQEGYYETDIAGNLTFMNTAFARICGYPPDELMGRHGRGFVSSDTLIHLEESFGRVFRTGVPANNQQYGVITGDGTRRTLEASISLMRDEQGEAAGFRGLVRDVTEQLRLEEEKRKLEEDLLQARKREAIGALDGGVAHDFNNLLMAIQGNTALMLLGKDPQDPDCRHLAKIEKHIQDAAGLTRQLLGFARGGKYDPRPTNINDLVRETYETFGRARKQVRCRFELLAQSATKVDRGQMEQVFLNLFLNAWQAMPEGGDMLVSTDDVLLDEAAIRAFDVRPGQYVKVRVSDQGTGMDEDVLKKVFDPFFTTREKARGTGMGLASAQGIVKNHGGFITASSKHGKGSVFDIFLPVSHKPAPREAPPPTEVVSGTGTILFVDDEPDILSAGSELIESLGYDVLTALGGEEALKMVEENKEAIDLIILDMIMPVVSGRKVFEEVHKRYPGMRVLLCSGYSLEGEAAEILEMGCNGFIQKPFSLREISSKIQEILQPVQDQARN